MIDSGIPVCNRLGGTYLCRVRARNGAGHSAYSDGIKVAKVDGVWTCLGST
jgi:hypothetical protein